MDGFYDQDEAASSAGEDSLDRVHWAGLQATGLHYRDTFYDQDEAARSAGDGSRDYRHEGWG